MESRRRGAVVSLLVLTLALWGASGLLDPAGLDSASGEPVAQGRLIQPTANGSALWPYTSSGRTVAQRTLAINVIVYGSDENVKRALMKRGELEFQPVESSDYGADANATANATAANGTATPDGSALTGTPTADGSVGTANATATNSSANGSTSTNGTAANRTAENGTAANATATPSDDSLLGPDLDDTNETPVSNASANGTTTPSEGTFRPNETVEANGTATPTPDGTPANNTTPVDDERNDSVSQVVEIKPTGIQWTDAHGAVRYTYIDTKPGEGGGRWLEESYQLRSGPYLGRRIHIRAYASPTDRWTALQVHEDYWDWFRLRHTVPNSEAERIIENDFIGEPYVEDVSRVYYGIHGGGSDGWLSVIEFSSAAALLSTLPRILGASASATAALLAVVSADTRAAAEHAARRALREAYRQRGGIVLAGLLGAVVIGVRVGGIAIETTFTGLHPKLIVAVLYPVLALGLPAIAAVGEFTRETDPGAAFGLVVVGVGAAFVLDLGMIGVTSVPVGLVLHRCGLLVSLGMIAAGSARGGLTGRQLRLVGVAMWVVGLVWPLLDFL